MHSLFSLFSKGSLALLFLLLSAQTCSAQQEFGIGGWIHDPISLATATVYPQTCHPHYWAPLENVTPAMNEMLSWCDDMQFTTLAVEFQDPSLYQYMRGHSVKGVNSLGPMLAKHYLYSMYKSLRVGGRGDNWWDEDFFWPRKHSSVQEVTLNGEAVHSLTAHTGEVDWMWSPSSVGNFRGRGRGNYLPIHIRVACAAEINWDSTQWVPDVAEIQLFFQGSDSLDNPSDSTPGRIWWRFPVLRLPAAAFDSNESLIDTFDFVIDPSPGGSGLVRRTSGETWLPFGVSDSSAYSFDTPTVIFPSYPARIGLRHLGGGHTFYLKSIEVWDDDYHRLCVQRDEQLADSIADAYYSECGPYADVQGGWMLDDQLYDLLRPMVRLMEIAHDDPRPMPPFYTSAFNNYFGRFYAMLDTAGIPHPIQCNEQYWFGGDSVKRGSYYASPLGFLYTRTSSDTSYLELRPSEMMCAAPGNPQATKETGSGRKSLQFAIDEGIWGVLPYVDSLNAKYPNFYDLYVGPPQSRPWPMAGGMMAEIDAAHNYGGKYWAMLQAGRYGAFGFNDCLESWEGRFPARETTYNEMKLQVWLAAACNVDGIMWYGTLSTPCQLDPTPPDTQGYYSCLFEWGDQEGTPYEGSQRSLYSNGPRHVYRTERYYGAKYAQDQLLSLVPTLSHLRFIRTFASRAFEHSYGDAGPDSQWVATDHLFGQTTLESIDTFKPGNPTAEYEPADERYVQISRFMSPGLDQGNAEDAWYLIVNRRALQVDSIGERRTVRLTLAGVQYPASGSLYLVDSYLAGTQSVAATGSGGRKYFEVDLGPGDAELVHFYYANTADTVITEDCTLYAPLYSARNIVIRGQGKLTIIPNETALLDSFFSNCATKLDGVCQEGWVHRYDSVATVTFWKGKGIRVESNSTSDSSRLVIHGSIVNDDTIRVRLQPALTDSGWTGIKVTSGQGRGQVTMHLADVTGAKRGFWRYGKSIQADSLVDCRFYGNETGVLCQSSPANSAIFVGQCKLEDNRDFGLRIGGKVKATLHGSSISDNRTGIAAVSSSIVTLINCDVLRNADEGISLASGVILTDSVGGLIANNGGHAISATKSCTVNLDHSAVTQNGAPQSEGGVKAVDSQLRLRCSEIRDNTGTGLFVYRGSVLMSDTATSGNFRWGGNRLSNNTMEQLQLDSVSVLGFANGENVVIGNPTTDIPWVDWNNLWTPLSYRRNHWGFASDADSAKVVGNQLSPDQPPHLSPVVWVKPVKPDSTRCLWEPDGGPSDVPPCFVDANTKEVDGDLSNAQSDYKSIIQSTLADCGKYASIARLLAIDALGGFNNAETREFLTAVLDTTNDDELRHVTRLAVAQTWSKDQEWDSATTIYSMIHDEAGTNLYRRIDAELGLVTTAILETEFDDTTGGPSYEAFQSYRDTVEQILDQRFSWHQWQITDSVVMYAPMRVDSAIEIHAGGVLTILPRPGSAHPVVHFGPDAGIYSYGYQGQAKFYVLGEADNPVVLSWDSSSAWANVQTLGGDVYMKHATLQGRGFLSYSDASYGSFDFEVDSCQFEGFDEGIWVWAADSGSYIKNSVLTGLGGSAGYETGMGFGTGLTVLESEQFTVENCSFVNNQGVGLFGYFCSALDVRNTIITGSSEYGILVWDGGALDLECTEVTQNGDTLPEIWVENGVVDLVEGHNLFADSGGTLIYSANPSYIDVEDGQNRFELYSDSGKYFESGLPNSTWDVTYNNWSPLTPADQGFYNHLTPTDPAKWTVDSSLASFVACGDGGAMSMGGNLLVVGQAEETPGVDSRQGDAERGPARITTDHHASKLAKSTGSGLQRLDRSALSSDSPEPSSPSRDAVRLHHTELAQWREFNALAKSNHTAAAIDAGKQFIATAPGSPMVASALVRLASLADHSNPAAGLSSALAEQAKQLPRAEDRRLARRLSYRTLAVEGSPQAALSGLEEMIETAETPQDSLRALVTAMGVYLNYGRDGQLQARNPSVRVNDPRELARRVVHYAKAMQNPTLLAVNETPAVPQEYKLYQNFPNPFNPNTEIRFDLPEAVNVQLRVFNILGQEVATLVDAMKPAGAFNILWDSKNAAGSVVASGVYVYQLKAGKFIDQKKMVLIR